MNDIEPSLPLRIQNKLSIYNVLERRLLRVASEKECPTGTRRHWQPNIRNAPSLVAGLGEPETEMRTENANRVHVLSAITDQFNWSEA